VAFKEADAIVICVPTPLTETREPDLSYIESTARMLKDHIRRGQLIVLESTTYPGTTEDLVKPILKNPACGPAPILPGVQPRTRRPATRSFDPEHSEVVGA